MKIFNKTDHQKVNFVDENNIVLGYDTFQQCCEYASWFIADQPCRDIVSNEIHEDDEILDLPGWRFDPAYFRYVLSNECEELDNGTLLIFRIVNNDGEEKFIHLFNCHNGYYEHGFSLQRNKDVICRGNL